LRRGPGSSSQALPRAAFSVVPAGSGDTASAGRGLPLSMNASARTATDRRSLSKRRQGCQATFRGKTGPPRRTPGGRGVLSRQTGGSRGEEAQAPSRTERPSSRTRELRSIGYGGHFTRNDRHFAQGEVHSAQDGNDVAQNGLRFAQGEAHSWRREHHSSGYGLHSAHGAIGSAQSASLLSPCLPIDVLTSAHRMVR
jgi:hypothetical protein